MTTAAAIAAAYPRAGLPLAREIVAVAGRLGADPAALAHLINFESAGTFSSSVKNPTSGATGLIQFMPNTARGLGTSTAALSRLTPVQQMSWVERYLSRRGRLDTPQALYMSVFYPAAMRWPSRKKFPEWVTRSNPGITTPGDYVAKVEARSKPIAGSGGSLIPRGAALSPVAVLLAASVAIMLGIVVGRS